MTVTRGSWHFHLFHFGLLLVDMFTGRGDSWRSYKDRFIKRGTNLCHYMRVILVYTPLILTVYAATAAGVVWVSVFLPIKLFGITGYMNTLLVIGGVVVGIILAVVGIICVVSFLGWAFHKTGEIIGHTKAPVLVQRGLNFGDLMVEWMIARKKAICPTLTFADVESAEGGTE